MKTYKIMCFQNLTVCRECEPGKAPYQELNKAIEELPNISCGGGQKVIVEHLASDINGNSDWIVYIEPRKEL